MTDHQPTPVLDAEGEARLTDYAEWLRNSDNYGNPYEVNDNKADDIDNALAELRALRAASRPGRRAEVEGLIESVEGPHEWGYRDLTDGTFIADDAPFNLAQRIREGRLTDAITPPAAGEEERTDPVQDAEPIAGSVLSDGRTGGAHPPTGANSPTLPGEAEEDWPISKDGPHTISDARRWLARQLMDSRLSEAEAIGIVAHHPALAAGLSDGGKG